MVITFNQIEEDLIEFNLYYSWSSPEKKYLRLYCKFFPLLAFILLKLILYKSYFYYHDIYWIIGFIILGLTITPFQKLYNKVRISYLLKSNRNSDLVGNRKITFEENKVLIETDNSKYETIWSTIERLAETNKYLFLFTSFNQAIVIPKRAFRSTKENDELKFLINVKIGK